MMVQDGSSRCADVSGFVAQHILIGWIYFLVKERKGCETKFASVCLSVYLSWKELIRCGIRNVAKK